MDYFRNNYASRNAERVLMVVFAIIAVASPLVTLTLLQEEKKVLIVDQAGTYHLVPSVSMRDAEKLRMQCVKLSLTALLTRTPDGYLNADLLYQCFARNCDKALEDELTARKADFELKNMRQMPEIQKIILRDQGNGYYLAHAKVYLTRACEFEKQKYVETATAVVTLLLVENPDISANGRLPLVVVEIRKLDYYTENKP